MPEMDCDGRIETTVMRSHVYPYSTMIKSHHLDSMPLNDRP